MSAVRLVFFRRLAPCSFVTEETYACYASRELHLYSNSLNGTLPSCISSMTALQDLQLYSNVLSGPIPTAMSYLTKLSILRLQYNTFSGAFPGQLGLLPNLM